MPTLERPSKRRRRAKLDPEWYGDGLRSWRRLLEMDVGRVVLEYCTPHELDLIQEIGCTVDLAKLNIWIDQYRERGEKIVLKAVIDAAVKVQDGLIHHFFCNESVDLPLLVCRLFLLLWWYGPSNRGLGMLMENVGVHCDKCTAATPVFALDELRLDCPHVFQDRYPAYLCRVALKEEEYFRMYSTMPTKSFGARELQDTPEISKLREESEHDETKQQALSHAIQFEYEVQNVETTRAVLDRYAEELRPIPDYNVDSTYNDVMVRHWQEVQDLARAEDTLIKLSDKVAREEGMFMDEGSLDHCLSLVRCYRTKAAKILHSTRSRCECKQVLGFGEGYELYFQDVSFPRAPRIHYAHCIGTHGSCSFLCTCSKCLSKRERILSTRHTFMETVLSVWEDAVSLPRAISGDGLPACLLKFYDLLTTSWTKLSLDERH